MIKIIHSDNLFLKAALDLSFQPGSFVPGLIPRLEVMVVSPILNADLFLGLHKQTLGFYVSLQ